MKKVLSCMLVVVMLLSFTMAASAAGFVPSVSYKPAPEIVDIVDHEHNDCIIITPVADAKESEDLTEEKKDALLEQYEKLSDPDTKISDLVADFEDDLVVKDLFDVTIICSELTEDLHDGETIDVVLKTPVAEKGEIYAMVYVDGKWTKVPAVNNGDGTITLTLSGEGIVALLVPAEEAGVDIPDTGDNSKVIMWSAIMLGALALIVVLVFVNRRIGAKEGK